MTVGRRARRVNCKGWKRRKQREDIMEDREVLQPSTALLIVEFTLGNRVLSKFRLQKIKKPLVIFCAGSKSLVACGLAQTLSATLKMPLKTD